jgi:hypothetical protein
MQPIITWVNEVQVTVQVMVPFLVHHQATQNDLQQMLQTDEVRDIPCGTRGGVLITFDKVSDLEIHQDCRNRI